MNLPRHFTTKGIVLRRHNYAEADRILTVLTRKYGKLSAIAKGVRKLTSKKSPHIEPFTLSDMQFVRGSNLHLLTEAATVDSYSQLRQDLFSTRLSFYLCEVVDKLTADYDPQTDVFDSLVATLTFLNHQSTQAHHQQEDIVNQFQLSLLKSLGFGAPTRSDSASISSFIESITDLKLRSRSTLS